MQHFARFASWAFGLSLVALSFFVALETICRKLLNFSFEGADELGGYVLAIGSSLAFTVALVDRAHVRIDFLHRKLPATVRSILDWLSIVSLALFGAFLAYVGYFVITDTLTYGSVAPTPWATPIIYPQAGWYAGYILFAVVAVGLALYATGLLLRGRFDALSEHFDPMGVDQEVKKELANVQVR